jgi:hypothetical protein
MMVALSAAVAALREAVRAPPEMGLSYDFFNEPPMALRLGVFRKFFLNPNIPAVNMNAIR